MRSHVLWPSADWLDSTVLDRAGRPGQPRLSIVAGEDGMVADRQDGQAHHLFLPGLIPAPPFVLPVTHAGT